MECKDEAAAAEWAKFEKINSTDPYSNATVQYARRWADLMEAELAEGKELEAIAEPTSYVASEEHGGVTGFMHGAAVSALAKWWVHGEQLRQWHNLHTQLGTEGEKANKTGGVLNPALVSVSVPDSES